MDTNLFKAILISSTMALTLSSCDDNTAINQDEITVSSSSALSAVCNSNAASIEEIVTASENFLALLTDDQKEQVILEFNFDNADTWSNLPVGGVGRNGLAYEDLTDAQKAAAVEVQSLSLSEKGCNIMEELRTADDILGGDRGGYGADMYYIAFLGEPSTENAFMIQLGGHHLGYNLSFNAKAASAAPLFLGLEPTVWEDDNGVEHEPLQEQRETVEALSLEIQADSELFAKATLEGVFSDMINGAANPGFGGGGPGGPGGPGMPPGDQDGNFPAPPADDSSKAVVLTDAKDVSYPTEDRGLAVSELSTTQQELVKDVIKAWVNNANEVVADEILADYLSDASMAETYIGIGVNSDGIASFKKDVYDLTAKNSYLRIDGPKVWIEFSVQGGIIYQDRLHYHTIWRDKEADYGAEFIESK